MSSQTKFMAQGRFICLRQKRNGTNTGYRRRRGREQMRGEKRDKREGYRIFSTEGKDCLCIEETDVAHRKMAVYKGTREKPVLGEGV